jgi:hypothetical protein
MRMEWKREIKKLLRTGPARDGVIIEMTKSDTTLKGDQPAQIDYGKFPNKVIKLSARRDCVFPGGKHAGEFFRLGNGDGRIR